MRTVAQYLLMIPDNDIRRRLRNNIPENLRSNEHQYTSLNRVVNLFTWQDSREGHEFWDDLSSNEFYEIDAQLLRQEERRMRETEVFLRAVRNNTGVQDVRTPVTRMAELRPRPIAFPREGEVE